MIDFSIPNHAIFRSSYLVTLTPKRLRIIAIRFVLILTIVSVLGMSVGCSAPAAYAAAQSESRERADRSQAMNAISPGISRAKTDDPLSRTDTIAADLPPASKHNGNSAVSSLTQSNGNRIWAGTSNAGIWLYEDGAWIHRSNGLGSGKVNSLAVNPFNHDVLLAVVSGYVYRTEDAGLFWSRAAMPFTQQGWNRIAWDRATPGEVVISGPELGEVYSADPRAAISYDGGLRWSGIDLDTEDGQLGQGFPGDVWGLDGTWYMIGNSGLNLYFAPCTMHAMWRSFDHGQTWELLCTWPRGRWQTARFITGLWSNPNHLFGAYDHAYKNLLVESSDAGQTWNSGSQAYHTARQFLADPYRDGTLWLVAEGRLLKSSEGISNFQEVLRLGSGVNAVAVDGYGGAVYGGGNNRHVAYSLDEGAVWENIDLPKVPPVVDDTHILVLAAELSPLVSIPDRSDLSDCQPKDGLGDSRECQVNATSSSQGYAGDPINTRTGGFDLILADLSINTSAGPLVFQRTYSSLASENESGRLGFGWTNNHDTRLIFPDQAGGEEGVVWFKAHTANQYRFDILPNGAYRPAKGVLATLVRQAGPPVRYVLTDRAQQTYTFDEEGKLLTWTNAVGNGFHYDYDARNRLERVSDDHGNRYLVFSYDADGRILAVGDHDGRSLSFSYNAAGNLINMVDVMGETWSYDYDQQHRLIRMSNPQGVDSLRVEYDEQGRAVRQFDGLNRRTVEVAYNTDGSTSLTDGRGFASIHVYDQVLGNLIKEIDPLGGVTNHTYDANFRPTSFTDPLGRITRLDWSTNGHNLITTTDAADNMTRMDYDANNRLIQVVDPLLRETKFDYEGPLLNEITDALNGTISFTYTAEDDAPQPVGLLKTITDALGYKTSFAYDALGDRISMIDALDQTWSYTYNGLGWLETVTDPRGVVTRYEYDNADRITKIVRNHDSGRPQNDEDVYNITTRFIYDSVGNLTDAIDTLGRITHYSYDDANQLIKAIENYRPGFASDSETNVTTEFRYDPAGNAIAIIDPLGGITRTYYDELNRPAIVVQNLIGWQIDNSDPPTFDPTHPDRNVPTYYRYDAVGNLTTIEDALGTLTYTCYESRNLPVKSITNPTVADPCDFYDPSVDPALDIIQSWTYDDVGNVLSWSDPRGYSNGYDYDKLNRLKTVINPLGFTTAYDYDALGNLTFLTDAEGVVTGYQYDGLSRLKDVIENSKPNEPADHQTNVKTSYVYDEVGNRIIDRDANGGEWSFVYDPLNRLIVEADPLNRMMAYGYDPLGNLTARVDAELFLTIYTYDRVNRLAGIDYAEPDADAAFTYDATGNIRSRLDGLGRTAWEYDGLYRPITIIDPFGRGTGYGYDAVGNRTALIYPDGKSVAYGYDAAHRLAQIQDWDNNLTAYTYDKSGLPNTISLPNGILSSYDWDAAERLERLEHSFGAETLAAYSYTYDRIGNRAQAVEVLRRPAISVDYPYKTYFPIIAQGNPGHPEVTIDYTYDPLYRLTAADYSSGEYFHYTYDAAGNRLSEATREGINTYIYDAAHQITQVDGISYSWDENRNLISDGDRNFSYDHADRLVALSDQGSDYSFAYNSLGDRYQQTLDGDTTTYALDLAAGLTQVLSDGTTDYLYGLGRIGESGSDGWQYPLSDALGSARQLANAAGAITLSRSYEPFGSPLKSYGVDISVFGFTGEQDEIAGLVYLRARYYDPATGRFIS
jgi:YD repeat-containing protein